MSESIFPVILMMIFTEKAITDFTVCEVALKVGRTKSGRVTRTPDNFKNCLKFRFLILATTAIIVAYIL